jgi:uncharacterized cupin superfamily protein
MKQLFKCGVISALLVVAIGAQADDALKPRKVAAAEASGRIFESPSAKHDSPEPGSSNVEVLKSSDGHFVAGIYKAGASDFPIDSYPVDEFCFFLSGSVTLKSADGTSIDLKAGDAVVIPKGW